MASLVAGQIKSQTGESATEAQKEYLRRLGLKDAEILSLDKAAASERIDALRSYHQTQAPPTEKQLAHLQRLGASTERIAQVVSQADASALIESMHLNPTRMQIELLHKLGATGAQIARLKTKADASELIESLGG